MGTFTTKSIVDQIIARNGDAEVEPGMSPEQAKRLDIVRIVEYTTPEGETCWGAVYRCEAAMSMLHRYDNTTQYILNPRVIFERKES